MERPILEVQHLSVGLQIGDHSFKAVDDISFSLHRGQTYALLGESGCGKTTTALAINRLLPPSATYSYASVIKQNDVDLLQLSEVKMRRVRGSSIGMIFQEPMTSLNPVLTVGAQISEAIAEHQHLSATQKKTAIFDMLTAVGLPAPEKRYHEYPHQLSGGMKQRVMIAMALIAKPAILIADEPTTALDVTIQAQILQLLKDLQQQTGMAILLISHDLGVVSRMADHVGVMYAGKIVEEATTRDFFAKPVHPYSQQLFAVVPTLGRHQQKLAVTSGQVPALQDRNTLCQFTPRCVHAFADCYQRPPHWNPVGPEHFTWCHLYEKKTKEIATITLDEDASYQGVYPTQEQYGDPVLEIRDLQVYFPIQKGLLKRVVGQVKAVDGVNLALYSKKTLALVGESGCGKTTLGKAMLHLIKPTSGDIIYQQRVLSGIKTNGWHALRHDLQIVFQDPYSSLNPHWLVEDIIAEGLVAQKMLTSAAERTAVVEKLLHDVGLPADSRFRYPHEFSGGQRQRICIARALAVDPKVIICDEPTSALDLSVQAQILNLLRQLQDRYHLAYLFISHNISVVAYLADEIAVMYLGRIVEQGPVQHILNAPKHPYTQALMAAVPKIGQTAPVVMVKGEAPSPAAPPTGCHFHPRCPLAMDICRREYPPLTEVGAGWGVKCFLYPSSS